MSSISLSSLSLRKSPQLTDQEFKQLRDMIYDLAGIDIPEKRKYLIENKLGPRLQELNLKSYSEYYDYIRYDKNHKMEVQKLFENITTNETSFFRDIKQLDVFKDHILKEVIEKQQEAGKKELNIWSAGCSSGEEPYTIGILLHEILRMSIIGWKIRITANDISLAMIAKARHGVYNEHSLRTTPKQIVEKYFTKEPGGYKIHPKVQKLVSLAPINLKDVEAVKRVPKSHIVFCRNVIIYFDDEMKKHVINCFYDNLLPGGCLLLGHSESIHKISRGFMPIIKPGGIAYRKRD